MALQTQLLFSNLNLFIRDEVIPINNNNVALKADIIELPETNVSFTKIEIIPNRSRYNIASHKLDPRLVPNPFIPLLAKLHQQVYDLLTQDVYKLNKVLTPAFKKDKFLFDIQRLSATTVSYISLNMRQDYDNVFEYAQNQQSNNNLFKNLVHFSIDPENITDKEVDIPIVELQPVYQTVNKKTIATNKMQPVVKGYKSHAIDVTRSQAEEYAISFDLKTHIIDIENDLTIQLSLLRMIWAIESINKIKSSILYRTPSVIFLDNLDFQTRMLLTPYYFTKLNLDSLALYNQSPIFNEMLKNDSFNIHRHYEVKKNAQLLVQYEFLSTEDDQYFYDFPYSMTTEVDLFDMLFLRQQNYHITK